MAKAIQENIEFYRGRTYSRDFTINDFTDQVDDIKFTACENPANKHYCLRKSLGKGIEVVDTGTNEDGTTYTTYNLTIEATDTDHLKANFEYGYDIVLYSGNDKHQLIEGKINLLSTFTKSCNEC